MIANEFEYVKEWKGYDIFIHYPEPQLKTYVAFPIGAQCSARVDMTWPRIRDWCTRHDNN